MADIIIENALLAKEKLIRLLEEAKQLELKPIIQAPKEELQQQYEARLIEEKIKFELETTNDKWSGFLSKRTLAFRKRKMKRYSKKSQPAIQVFL